MAYARFLPEQLPPPAQRLIEEFAFQRGDPPILVGGYVRLQLLGQLHDAYVIAEEEHHLHMRTKCGVDVRQPREEVGAMRWPVEPDTNPHSVSALKPDWFLLATERPRSEQVGSIDIHLPPVGTGAGFAEGMCLPPSSNHRRVRLFSMQEDRRHPSRKPNFVYVKLYHPYLLLRPLPVQRSSNARPRSAAGSRTQNVMQLQQDMLCAYMREHAAHSILHLCQPQVAPRCFHSSVNEATGSYTMVMDDCVNTALPWVPWKEEPIVIPLSQKQGRTEEEEAQDEGIHKNQVKNLGKLFEATAIFHGRFMRNHGGSVPVGKDLLKAMVHPKLFYATWRDALDTEKEEGEEVPELLRYLAEIYGVELPAPSAPATVPAGAVEPLKQDKDDDVEISKDVELIEEPGTSTAEATIAAPTVTKSGLAQEKRNLLAYPNSFPIDQLAPSNFASSTSLSLIHGRLHEPTHVRLNPDPRGVPQTLFLDWKYSGIGPIEVDLLQLLMLVPASVRRKDPDMLYYCLDRYLTTIKIFYSELVEREMVDLLCRMRTVALLCLGSDPFDWNGQGDATPRYVQLHHELCEKTTRKQLVILQKKIDEGEPFYRF